MSLESGSPSAASVERDAPRRRRSLRQLPRLGQAERSSATGPRPLTRRLNEQCYRLSQDRRTIVGLSLPAGGGLGGGRPHDQNVRFVRFEGRKQIGLILRLAD